jgi:hypothetical protein
MVGKHQVQIATYLTAIRFHQRLGRASNAQYLLTFMSILIPMNI